MFYIIHHPQILDMRALPDVLTYSTAAQSATTYLEPQLFEELKTILVH
jgi:hypothetical protein